MTSHKEKLLALSDCELFAEGRQRVCYRHPENEKLLVKVDKDDVSKPVTSKELNYLNAIQRRRPDIKLTSIAHCHGSIVTDVGLGAVYDLIYDEDQQKTAITLAALIEADKSASFKKKIELALNNFRTRVYDDAIIIRDLNSDNLCARCLLDGSIELIAVDGFGHKYPFPQKQIYLHSKRAANWKMKQLFDRFHFTNVDALFEQPTQRRVG